MLHMVDSQPKIEKRHNKTHYCFAKKKVQMKANMLCVMQNAALVVKTLIYQH